MKLIQVNPNSGDSLKSFAIIFFGFCFKDIFLHQNVDLSFIVSEVLVNKLSLYFLRVLLLKTTC